MRRFKTHPPDLWLDNISNVETASMPTVSRESSEEASPPPSHASRSHSPSQSRWPEPSAQETRAWANRAEEMGLPSPLGNLPKNGPCASQKIKAAVQLGPTAPVEFHFGSPPAKFAHLVCGSQWAQKSPHLHCPNLPLVAYGEVLHHSYHGGNKLGIVVIRSNVTTLKAGQKMQVECRIGLEDEVAPPFLWWLQAQVYLHSFFQRKLKLSAESGDVRLNSYRWEKTVSKETQLEMHIWLFVKGCSPELLQEDQEVTLHDAPKKDQDDQYQRYQYQPEVFGARKLKLKGRVEDFEHLAWAIRHRPEAVGS